MSFHTPYRWCIAPICNNTSSKTPEKLFIRVPSDDIYMRNVWIELAGRDPTKLSTKSLLHLCEDHFDLEKDMENYMRFKIMGSVKKIRMKPNTIPSKFSHKTIPSQAAERTSTVHPRSVDELIYDVPFVVKEEAVCVKVEPLSDDGGASEGHVVEDELVQGPERVGRPQGYIHLVKEEPESMDEVAEPVKAEACVKSEPLSDDGGVSEAAARAGLYTDHVVKDELVLGPEHVDRPQGYIPHSPGRSERAAEPERCIDIAATSAQLGRHSEDTNSGALQPAETNIYVCDTCGRIHLEKNSLILHLRVHMRKINKGNKTKTYTCDICEKHFSYPSSLSMHKRLHAGVKPYVCNICRKAFTQSSQLKRHQRIHTGVKLYYCEVCNMKFRESGQLKLHKWSHTDDKPYSCEICKRGFARYNHFNMHKLIHAKPFSCHVCKKMFARLMNLKIHTAVHTGEKPYACDICNKRFVISSYLKTHKRIHEGKPVFP